jgi:two-component system NarL family response regulator
VLFVSAGIQEALLGLRTQTPDVVLLDLELVAQDTLHVLGMVRVAVPTARIIVMGMMPLQDDLSPLIRAGATGFVMKEASLGELLTTIGRVADGASVLPPPLTASLFGEIAHPAVSMIHSHALDLVGLTPREREVIVLISEGLSNKEIAIRLKVAVHTVKSHVHNVLDKLALRTRLEVAAFTRVAEDHAASA